MYSVFAITFASYDGNAFAAGSSGDAISPVIFALYKEYLLKNPIY